MFAGDAGRLAGPLNGMSLQPKGSSRTSVPPHGGFTYLNEADLKDPLVFPLNSPKVLAKFPPTLILTSTRAFEFSSAIDTHNALVRAGVDAELHVWDGLPHAFWYNCDLPESREAYDVIARFFDRRLAH
jgi:acetyl esterase/lipase